MASAQAVGGGSAPQVREAASRHEARDVERRAQHAAGQRPRVDDVATRTLRQKPQPQRKETAPPPSGDTAAGVKTNPRPSAERGADGPGGAHDERPARAEAQSMRDAIAITELRAEAPSASAAPPHASPSEAAELRGEAPAPAPERSARTTSSAPAQRVLLPSEHARFELEAGVALRVQLAGGHTLRVQRGTSEGRAQLSSRGHLSEEDAHELRGRLHATGFALSVDARPPHHGGER